MTKISKKAAYPIKNPVRQDYFVGSDSENNGKTVNFDFEKTAKLINELSGTSIVNYLFKTDNNIPLEVLTEGVFLSESNETAFADITKLYINKKNFHETDMAELFQFIALNKEVFTLKIRNSSNLNNAVYFNITATEEFETHFILDVAIDIYNAAIPELVNFNVYFFDFELKSSGTDSDPLKLDKGSYTGNATNLDDRITDLENTTFPDAVLKTGEITIVDNEASIAIGAFNWRLNQVEFLNPPLYSVTVIDATDGFYRTDILVGDNTGNYHLIQGTEDEVVAPEPSVPDGMIKLSSIPVFGATIGSSVPSTVGDSFISKIEKDGWPDYASTGDNAFIPAPTSKQGILIVYNTGLNSIDGVDFSNVTDTYNGKEYIILNRTGGPITLNHFASVSTGQAGFRLLKEQPLIVPDRGQIAFFNFNKVALTQTWKSWDDVGINDIENLSTELGNRYTKSEADTLLGTKLDASAYNQHFKGVYVTLSALNIAYPTASVGDYAQVNEVGSTDVVNYNWDDEVSVWVAVGGTGGAVNTDALPEGSTNLYWTVARFLSNLTYANIIAALGYTPENLANKSDSYTVSSSTTYSSTKALVDGLATKVTGTNTSDSFKNIYYMGDSLTDDGTYIYAVSSNLGSTWNNYNYGRSGENTTQMLARFNTDIILKNNPSHVVILGGTNDVTALVSAATIESNLQAMYTAAKTAGIKVIAVTITPRTTTEGQLAIQNTVNTWIKTTAIDIDYIVDPYTTLADPSNPTQLLPAYTTDGLHMTTSGYTVLGNYIYSNSTWVAKINSTNLLLNVKGLAGINQDVSTTANPVFNTINDITVSKGNGNVYTNTAVGKLALFTNTYGKYNTSLGYFSLKNNTSGSENVAIGYQSMVSNTTGVNNVAMGVNSLTSNTTGYSNTAVGEYAMFGNTTGYKNVSVGQASLQSNTTGYSNVSVGLNSMLSNISGAGNTSFGESALLSNTTANSNSAFGNASLYSNTTGSINAAYGFNSMQNNTTGTANVAIGCTSLQNNISSNNNTALGYGALQYATGANNTVVGAVAGAGSGAGTNNTYVGIFSGFNGSGNNNVFLGSNSGYFETGTNKLFIDNAQRASESDARAKALIYGVFDASPSNQYLTINGNLIVSGTTTFTGTPSAPTATAGTNTTQIATTAFVLANAGSGDMTTTTAQTVSGVKTFLSGKFGLRNVANTFTSFFTNSNTASRTYTLPNADGEVAVIRTSGSNQYFGQYSLQSATGASNSAFGNGALYTTSTGAGNVAVGTDALARVTTGSYNTGIGLQAGAWLSGASVYNNTPSNSVYIGYLSQALAAGQTNQIVIGAYTVGAGSNTVTIGNTSITKTVLQGVINTAKTYTVATLPAGVLGDKTIVTDAVSPTYLGALTGGGSVTCPVFFNGTAWVSN